jgi:hypothetical protein
MRWRRRRKSPNQGNKARCGADVVRFSGRSANHTSESGTADGAVSGGFLGSLTGLIFLNAAAGAASGALTDVGINEHFMKELSATLSPRQFNPVRAAKKSHAGQGQGTGRTEGNRRENLEVAGTGATVAASVLKLGTLNGIERPAVACLLPTESNVFVLIDTGLLEPYPLLKRRRHETEFKARWVPLLPRESAKKTFNVGDRSLPERHALFPRRIDAWRA